jgi:fibronectin type 3 domain-containing protein
LSITVAAAAAYSAVLNWTASTSSDVTGYNVYRSTTSGGGYVKLNSSLVTVLTYTDSTVVDGQTYYYVTTSVDSSGEESAYSDQQQAVIP